MGEGRPRSESGQHFEGQQQPPRYEIKISAKKASYVVIIDKNGNEVAAHPILEFEIWDGPPNHFFDVQLSRDSAIGLTGGPGLPGSWDNSASRDDRVGQRLFSSFSNEDTALALDADGKANYKMPLKWWRDLARIRLDQFDKKDFYYRVIAMEDAATPPVAESAPGGGASAPKVEVKNNLLKFEVDDQGYIDGGVRKKVEMKYKLREKTEWEMYTIVQWNKGANRVWGGARIYAIATDYDIRHSINIPEWAIDRLHTDPRYWDGAYDEHLTETDTRYATDEPGGGIGSGETHDFYALDFETRLHLNFEVPDSVTITRQEGSAPVYEIVIGVLADPQPIKLTDKTWKARILQVRDADGNVTVTHPDTYAGPGP